MSGSNHLRVTRIKETEATVRQTDDGQFERTAGSVTVYTADGSRFEFTPNDATRIGVREGRVLPTHSLYLSHGGSRRQHPFNAPDGRGPR